MLHVRYCTTSEHEMLRHLSSFPVRFLGIFGACESCESLISAYFCHWKSPALCGSTNSEWFKQGQTKNAPFTHPLYPSSLRHDQHITSVRQTPLSATQQGQVDIAARAQIRNNKHGDFRSALVSCRTSELVQKPGKVFGCFVICLDILCSISYSFFSTMFSPRLYGLA